jgi:hypothetical protein
MEFESFRDFIDRISPVISENGMFVDSSFMAAGMPQTGETVDFEVRLTDDFRLVHGRGEVVWIRATGSDSGAAIRFDDLDEPGRRLVSRLITNYLKDGGEPFALELPTEPADVASLEPEPLEALEVEDLFAGSPEGLSTEPEELDSMTPPDVEERSEDVYLPFLAPRESGSDDDEPSVEEGDADETLELPIDIEAMDLDEPLAGRDDHGSVILDDLEDIEGETQGEIGMAPVEMPSEEERAELAGSDDAVAGRSPWRTLLIASLAGIVLGVAAWYFFDDQLRGLLGLDRVDETVASVPSETEGTTKTSIPAAGEREGPDSRQQELPREQAPEGALTGTEEPEAEATGTRDDVAEMSEVSGPAVGIVEESAGETGQETGAAVLATESSAGPVAQEDVPPTPVSRVEEITWTVADGATEVTIVTDGTMGEGSYDIVRIREGAPRELIRIYGISRPFNPNQLDVDSPQIVRLRTGLHADGARGVLHVVADLTGPGAAITLVRAEGRRLIVTFS